MYIIRINKNGLFVNIVHINKASLWFVKNMIFTIMQISLIRDSEPLSEA
jgi:hypothetical protein